MDTWIDLSSDPQHAVRERERARELRKSEWWRRQRAIGRCHYCGVFFPPTQLTMDHIVPVARGGRSIKSNIVPACPECNRKKKHWTPADQALRELNRTCQMELPDGASLFHNIEAAIVVNCRNVSQLVDWLRENALGLFAVVVLDPVAEILATADALRRDFDCMLVVHDGSATVCDLEIEPGQLWATPLGVFQLMKTSEEEIALHLTD